MYIIVHCFIYLDPNVEKLVVGRLLPDNPLVEVAWVERVLGFKPQVLPTEKELKLIDQSISKTYIYMYIYIYITNLRKG